MASLLALTHPRLLTAEEFLQIDFGPDLKAELDNGVIRMMAGGTRAHAQVQANLIAYLRVALRGSGCRPYGSDMAVKPHGLSIRYPDVTVDCGRDDDPGARELIDPKIIFEVLSPTTRDYDLRVKKAEYRDIASVTSIVFVDPEERLVAVSTRHGDDWVDSAFRANDIELPSLGLTIPHAEIFARD